MEDYRTIRGTAVGEYEEKKSRFIAQLSFADSEEKAVAFLEQVRAANRTARHNVYAYRLREGSRERYSDDGEPQGTAGLPMLEVFKREGVENVVCVVTRYFGGVLLGTGGLLRAYTKSAKDALDAAGIAAVRRWVKLEVGCPYSLFERMKTECLSLDGAVQNVDYGADVLLSLLLPENNAEAFSARVTELSAGACSALAVGEELMPVRIK